MKYDVLYAAVLSAAPTVLIAFVLEHRLLSAKQRFGGRWLAYTIVYSTGFSAMLSIIGLLGDSDSPRMAVVVALMLLFGIGGLLSHLTDSIIKRAWEDLKPTL